MPADPDAQPWVLALDGLKMAEINGQPAAFVQRVRADAGFVSSAGRISMTGPSWEIPRKRGSGQGNTRPEHASGTYRDGAAHSVASSGNCRATRERFCSTRERFCSTRERFCPTRERFCSRREILFAGGAANATGSPTKCRADQPTISVRRQPQCTPRHLSRVHRHSSRTRRQGVAVTRCRAATTGAKLGERDKVIGRTGKPLRSSGIVIALGGNVFASNGKPIGRGDALNADRDIVPRRPDKVLRHATNGPRAPTFCRVARQMLRVDRNR